MNEFIFKRKALATVLAFFSIMVLQCGEDKKPALKPGEDPAIYDPNVERDDDGNVLKFHTSGNPGQWEPIKDEHIPLALETSGEHKGKIMRKILVSVPLENDPKHYIEAIFLMDHQQKKELNIKRLTHEDKPKATFYLPEEFSSYVFDVIKCNQHDMWSTRLDLKRIEKKALP